MIRLGRQFSESLIVLALCGASAHAQTAKILFFRAGGQPPPGTQVIQPGITSADQTVIPRYVTGTSFPAGQIIGWGPESILAGTSATHSTGSHPAVVITAGYGDTLSQWQTQSTGTQPAVLQPIVRDITIAGYSTNNWDTGGAVNDNPQTFNKLDLDQYAGIQADAMAGTLDNVNFFFIPGAAVSIQRSSSTLNGATGQFDRVKWNVNKLNIHRVFRGLWMNATDSYLTDVEVWGFRDYGVRLGQYQTSGAIQFARLHAYGGGMLEADNSILAALNGNAAGLNGLDSPAIWIDGDTCHGVDCYGENAPIGLFIKGSYAALDGFYSHTCYVANVVLAGSFAHLSKARIDVLPQDWTIAYDNEASGPFHVGEILTFGGGAIGTLLALTDNGSTGTLVVRQASGVKPADNASITGGTSGASALVNGTPTVISRTGVNFANQYNTLSDSTINPGGSSTAVALNNGTNQNLRDIVIDSFGNSLGTGIDANDTLTNCHINAHVSGGGTALDLVDGGTMTTSGPVRFVTGGTDHIGSGNVIYITTSNGTGIAARLPAGWSTTPTSTTNEIVIDGVRYYPP